MGKKYLIVIDMQKDFVDGALGSKEAVEIIPNIVRKIENFDGDVIFTMDTHNEDYLNTQEGKKLPVKHCIKGTQGWEIVDELKTLAKEKNAAIYCKETFGSTKLAEDLKKTNEIQKIESIEIVGVCTDICVVSNALLIKANLPETLIKVDAGCCAGVTVEKHNAALETMKSCQIEVNKKE